MNTTSHQMWRILLVVVIVAAAVVLAAWLFANWRNRSIPWSTNTATVGQSLSTTTGGLSQFQPQLTVTDQFPGSVVYVSDVGLERGGWVVVREVVNDTAGLIIGAGYFDERVKNGVVNLSQTTAAGSSYLAVLHDDDGDQRFVETLDRPLLGADDHPVLVYFRAVEELPEQKD